MTVVYTPIILNLLEIFISSGQLEKYKSPNVYQNEGQTEINQMLLNSLMPVTRHDVSMLKVASVNLHILCPLSQIPQIVIDSFTSELNWMNWLMSVLNYQIIYAKCPKGLSSILFFIKKLTKDE